MESNYLLSALGEYGPLALIAGALIWTNLKNQDQQAKRLTNLEDRLMQLIENNTMAMTSLSITLNKRPCLHENNGAVSETMLRR